MWTISIMAKKMETWQIVVLILVIVALLSLIFFILRDFGVIRFSGLSVIESSSSVVNSGGGQL